jgi:hypothetical protein
MGAAVSGDVRVSATVSPKGLDYSGVLARAAGASDHYAAWVDRDGSVHIARRNAWSYTYLADATPGLSGPHKLTLRVQGTGPVQLTLYVDDNPIIAVTDSGASALGAAGGVGLFAWQGAGASFQHFLATQP